MTERCSLSALRGKIVDQAQHSLISVCPVVWIYYVPMFIFVL